MPAIHNNGVINNGLKGGSPLTEKKRYVLLNLIISVTIIQFRALPIHNKEEVFNEWGAILRHQDEIDQQMQKHNFEKMKIRQANYKMELDKQFRELQERK